MKMDVETYLRIVTRMNDYARRDGSPWFYALGLNDAAIVVVPR